MLALFCLFFIASQNFAFAQSPTKNKKTVKKVVLDAGHGGKDPGCHGQYSYEKNITLDVCKRVGKLLQDFYKGQVQVIYTRTWDELAGGDRLSVGQSLQYRHEIANQAQADVFLSVHVNSSPARVTTAMGTETYVLGLHRNEQKEGALGDHVDNWTGEPGVLDPKDPMTQIVVAQYSQTFLASSISLAQFVEEEFTYKGRKSLGVKQKGLEVLAGSAMPAVLIELGFLNNPAEEAYLNSEAGKDECAQAIFNAIKKYKEEVEKTGL